MAGLKGQDRTPREDVRARRNAARLTSVVEFIDANGIIRLEDGIFVLNFSTGLQESPAGTLVTKDSEIVHDNLSGFVAAEHYDWTNETHNLVTTGTGTFDEIILDASVGVGQGGLRWAGGSRLIEQISPARMLYMPNGDTFEVLNEAGTEFLMTVYGINASPYSNRIFFYKGVVIGATLCTAGTVPPSNGLRVQGNITIDADLTCDQVGFYGESAQAQAAHIVDADGTLADITSKFNTLLAAVEAIGLLASS